MSPSIAPAEVQQVGEQRNKKKRTRPLLEPVQADVLNGNSKFARALGSTDYQTREKGLQALTGWLQRKAEISDNDMLKIWKGLFYCFWMSDKVPVQVAFLYFTTFMATMRREWFGIDRLRLDKFLMLIRKFINHLFQYLQQHQWRTELVNQYTTFLRDSMLMAADVHKALGVAYHLADIMVPELCSAITAPIPHPVLELLLEPFMTTLANSGETSLVHRVRESVFDALLNEAQASSEGAPLRHLSAINLTDALFDLGAKPETSRRNREVLYGLSAAFKKAQRKKQKLEPGSGSGQQEGAGAAGAAADAAYAAASGKPHAAEQKSMSDLGVSLKKKKKNQGQPAASTASEQPQAPEAAQLPDAEGAAAANSVVAGHQKTKKRKAAAAAAAPAAAHYGATATPSVPFTSDTGVLSCQPSDASTGLSSAKQRKKHKQTPPAAHMPGQPSPSEGPSTAHAALPTNHVATPSSKKAAKKAAAAAAAAAGSRAADTLAAAPSSEDATAFPGFPLLPPATAASLTPPLTSAKKAAKSGAPAAANDKKPSPAAKKQAAVNAAAAQGANQEATPGSRQAAAAAGAKTRSAVPASQPSSTASLVTPTGSQQQQQQQHLASGVGATTTARKKAVRINLKKNLYFDFGGPVPDPDVRTPPTARSKGGILKLKDQQQQQQSGGIMKAWQQQGQQQQGQQLKQFKRQQQARVTHSAPAKVHTNLVGHAPAPAAPVRVSPRSVPRPTAVLFFDS